MFKSGFVSLVGRPNVGKSTLMNSLIGEKIAIVSNKPQTTRNKIQTILTTDDAQVVFIDTPGIHIPKSKLGEFMIKTSASTFSEVDVLLFLTDPTDKVLKGDLDIIEKFKNQTVFLVINKIDTIPKEQILKTIDNYRTLYDFKEIIPVSALKSQNTQTLLNAIKNYLPKGPKYFPDDIITDQPERQIVSEIIREKALKILEDEVPHGVAVYIDSMKERQNSDVVDICATIFCEKDSHKGIIIGKKGATLKQIGTWSRTDIERILGSKIFLELWVKVKKDWRDSDFLLRTLGYEFSP